MTPEERKAQRKELILSACRDLGFHGLSSEPGAIAAVASLIVQASEMGEEHDRATIGRLDAWVADLQSGMYVNCVYCGHRYGPKSTTPVTMADALKEHVENCERHPMSAMRKQLERLAGVIDYIGTADSGGELFPVGPADVEYTPDGNTVVRYVGPWRFLNGEGPDFLTAVEDAMRKDGT